MNFITKLLRADESRRTRFHCANGVFVDRIELLRLPHSLLLWLSYRAFGTYSPRPWWVWGAIHAVSTELCGDDVVLEHGSGMSSVWLARRSGHVSSIETSAEWQKRVIRQAEGARVTNLNVLSANESGADEFKKLLRQIKPTVVIIDGVGDRLELFQYVLQTNESARIIIYDNIDRPRDSEAYRIAADIENWTAHSFRGFAPAQLHANETAVFINMNRGEVRKRKTEFHMWATDNRKITMVLRRLETVYPRCRKFLANFLTNFSECRCAQFEALE